VAKAANKGKNEESNVVYDYDEGSVHDVALRAQVLRGYEEFKVRMPCHRPPFVYALEAP
jgi:hypothetical protein